MKRVYWLAPCLATALFAACYHESLPPKVDHPVSARPQIPRDFSAPYAGRDGRQEAEADWARGTPQYLTYGLPIHWTREFGEILQRDYGVEQHAVAGCVVSEGLVQYVSAYDAVTAEHLRALHGPQVMDELVSKAEALYATRHPSSASPDS